MFALAGRAVIVVGRRGLLVTREPSRRHVLSSEPWRNIMSFFERLKAAASAEWRAHTQHPFPNGLAGGLPTAGAFPHHPPHDYFFLIEFFLPYAPSVFKSPRPPAMPDT